MIKKLLVIVMGVLLAHSCFASQTTVNYNLVIPAEGDRDWIATISADIISIDSIFSIISDDVSALITSVSEGVAGPLVIDTISGAVTISIKSADTSTDGYIDSTQYLKINIISDEVGIISDDVGVLKTTQNIISADVGVLKSAGTGGGIVVQMVVSADSAVATGTGVISADDSIPQNDEGDMYMMISVTPKQTNNNLLVEAYAFFGTAETSSVHNIMTIISDEVADCLTVTDNNDGDGSSREYLYVSTIVSADVTSERTFYCRIGQFVGDGILPSTLTFNGWGGARRFGGKSPSYMRVTEYE
jgi:hypothetical protein